MTHSRHPLAAPLCAALVFLLPLAATGAPDAAVVDVRLATHADYDRLVIELDAETDVVLEPADEVGIVLSLAASADTPRRRLERSLPRIASVVLEQTAAGLEVRVLAPTGRVRSFALSDPFRVVVDVADAGAEPFVAPAGTLVIPERPIEPLVEPSPAPVEEPPVRVEEPTQAAEPPQLEEPGLGAKPAPLEEPAPVEEPREPEEPVLGEGLPPRPPPLRRAPEPEAPFLDRDTLEVALWIAGALGLAVVALVAISRRRRPVRSHADEDEWPDEPRSSESIRPDEILAAGDRVDVLEKRIDEEVRARTHMEERVTELQEDLKVLRDRVNRGRSELS